MELSKLQRELISRATAAAYGLFLLYLALGCYRWGEGIRTDPLMDEMRSQSSSRSRRAGNPLILPYSLMTLFGAAGSAVVLFAVLPTRALYAINPSHWEPG